MSHSYTRLLYHIVYSTKERVACIGDDLKPRLHAYLGGIVGEMKGTALIVGGTADHVHLLALLPATLAVADALRVMKCNSSGWVHDQWGNRGRFAWQTGYGAFTVSESGVERLTRYIAKQEEHHRRMTFQEEFLLLLKKHGIQHDERYAWD